MRSSARRRRAARRGGAARAAPLAPRHVELLSDGLIDPFSGLVYRDPVLADDGHTYEREHLESWLSCQGPLILSPTTRRPMGAGSMQSCLLSYLAPILALNHSIADSGPQDVKSPPCTVHEMFCLGWKKLHGLKHSLPVVKGYGLTMASRVRVTSAVWRTPVSFLPI